LNESYLNASITPVHYITGYIPVNSQQPVLDLPDTNNNTTANLSIAQWPTTAYINQYPTTVYDYAYTNGATTAYAATYPHAYSMIQPSEYVNPSPASDTLLVKPVHHHHQPIGHYTYHYHTSPGSTSSSAFISNAQQVQQQPETPVYYPTYANHRTQLKKKFKESANQNGQTQINGKHNGSKFIPTNSGDDCANGAEPFKADSSPSNTSSSNASTSSNKEKTSLKTWSDVVSGGMHKNEGENGYEVSKKVAPVRSDLGESHQSTSITNENSKSDNMGDEAPFSPSSEHAYNNSSDGYYYYDGSGYNVNNDSSFVKNNFSRQATSYYNQNNHHHGSKTYYNTANSHHHHHHNHSRTFGKLNFADSRFILKSRVKLFKNQI
jgi:hypothetical protein